MKTALAIALGLSAALVLQTTASMQQQPDLDRKVEGGGVTAPGWKGKEDAGNKQGLTIADSKFSAEGKGYHLSTGPAALYWNPANEGKGDFTVKATFTEPKQSFNHPHPYGVFIGGSNLDTAPSAVYCVAYRNGTYIIRMFNAGKRVDIVGRPAPSDAVKKAEADAPVVQEVAWTVKGDSVSCSINGTAVWTGTKADLTGEGKLATTDGIVGIRVSHNSDAMVNSFTLSK